VDERDIVKQASRQVATGPGRFGLIIGAAKCGTTSLFSYLQSHPQICGSRVKEPKFIVHDPTWKTGPSQAPNPYKGREE
jgi:hypothetical protein